MYYRNIWGKLLHKKIFTSRPFLLAMGALKKTWAFFNFGKCIFFFLFSGYLIFHKCLFECVFKNLSSYKRYSDSSSLYECTCYKTLNAISSKKCFCFRYFKYLDNGWIYFLSFFFIIIIILMKVYTFRYTLTHSVLIV